MQLCSFSCVTFHSFLCKFVFFPLYLKPTLPAHYDHHSLDRWIACFLLTRHRYNITSLRETLSFTSHTDHWIATSAPTSLFFFFPLWTSPQQRRSKWTWKAPSSPMEKWTVWAPAAPATWTTTAAGRAPSATRATPPAVTNWPSPLENAPACTFTTPAAVFYGFHLFEVPARRSVLLPLPPRQCRLTTLDGRKRKKKKNNSCLVQLASLFNEVQSWHLWTSFPTLTNNQPECPLTPLKEMPARKTSIPALHSNPKEDPDRSDVKARGQHCVSRHIDPLEPAKIN